MRSQPIFAVMPNFMAIPRPEGKMVISRQFAQGMDEFSHHWPGRMMAIVEPANAEELQKDRHRAWSGDDWEVDPKTLGFELVVMSFQSAELNPLLSTTTVVLGGLHARQNHLAHQARKLGVPFIYGAEHNLKTRLETIRHDEPERLRQLKRVVWELQQERLNREAIRAAVGLQCNGVPTFQAYKALSPSPLLFFDSRLADALLISPEVLEARLGRLVQGGPLRLGFWGDLNRLKGADHLVEVARILHEMCVPYRLQIWGSGELQTELSQQLIRYGIQDKVQISPRQPLEQISAEIQRNMDIFLCCHPQGDPVTAYLETLGHGLPIVGYANSALEGILDRSNVGQTVAIHDTEQLARVVRDLNQQRQKLADWSQTALNFARHHTFTRTFRRRVDHARELASR